MSELESTQEKRRKSTSNKLILDQVWNNEVEVNGGKIFLPDGRWVEIEDAQVKSNWNGDVYCDPLEIIIEPVYEQLYARVHNSIVAAGHCGISGPARFKFISLNFNEHATGELFDYDKKFIDREQIERRDGKEITFCSYFGVQERRGMLRLAEKATLMPPKLHRLRPANADTVCRYSIAIKVFLARAGYPEFCLRSIPKAFRALEAQQQRQANQPR